MPIDEKIILEKAVEKGWIDPKRFLEFATELAGNHQNWRVIPGLLQSGELTLSQVESLALEMPAAEIFATDEPGHEDVEERYQIVELIGSGGMSDVYKSFDRKLQRYVALKKLKTPSSDPHPRFLREARMQARIDHEHICRIYDIVCQHGEWYIAMALIEGRTLKASSRELGLEEKIRLVRDAAEGLNAAHRLGLIHRDVKPANIMVESDSSGWRKTYVMDFGLVREVTGEEATLTHDFVGSPAYMAPEQLSADPKNEVDRRADIWGLGATLYELLCGRLPFAGDGMADIIVNVLQKEPVPLRRIVPSLPVDLETIVMKCLEKDPSRRYGSMRELADDLDRFLDGIPISARRYNFFQRFSKLVRRHRLVSGVVAISTILVLATAGLWIHARIRARAQAEIAGLFGRDVEKIESIMRFACLVPPHDIRNDQEQVRGMMSTIRKRMKELGKAGVGPGHYALGQGFLALRDFKSARNHLEIAWKQGVQTPEAAFALGVSLQELYEEEKRKLERISDPELRGQLGERLDRELGGQALEMLNLGKSSPGVPAEYIEALIAFHQREYERALKILAARKQKKGSFYEMAALAGDSRQARGLEFFRTGKTAQALQQYEQALAAYDEALSIGRSDPYLYLRKGEVFERIAYLRYNTNPGDFDKVVEQGKSSCDQALEIFTELHRARNTKALMFIMQAGLSRLGGGDPDPFLKRAEAEVKRTIAADPGADYSNYLAGRITFSRVILSDYMSMDPVPPIEIASRYFERALELNPANVSARIELSQALILKGFHLFWRGQNPDETLNRAVENFRPLLADFPNFSLGYSTLGNSLYFQFLFRFYRGEEQWETLDRAVACIGKAKELNPDAPNYLTSYGWILVQKAKCLANFGRSGADLLEEALKISRGSLRFNPNYLNTFINMGVALSEQAREKFWKGFDPEPELGESESWLEKARIARSPNFEMFYPLLANELLRCQRAARQGRSVIPFVKKAREKFEQCRVMNSLYHDAYDLYAMVLAVAARQNLASGRSEIPELDEMQSILEHVSALKPDFFLHEKLLAEAALLRLRLEGKRGPVHQTEAAEVRRKIERAISLNPHYAPAYLLLAEFCLWKSAPDHGTAGERDEIIVQGIRAAERALSLNPRLIDAEKIKAELLQKLGCLKSFD